MTLSEISELADVGSYLFLAELVRRLKPVHILELGTGAGRSADYMMQALPPKSRLTTINWPNPPSGDDVGLYLSEWRGHPGLRMITGDTADQETAARVVPNVDMMLIDSTHTAEHVAKEWAMYEPKLADRAIVLVDDLHMYDLMEWWVNLPYDKIVTEVRSYGLGVFQYVRKP